MGILASQPLRGGWIKLRGARRVQNVLDIGTLNRQRYRTGRDPLIVVIAHIVGATGNHWTASAIAGAKQLLDLVAGHGGVLDDVGSHATTSTCSSPPWSRARSATLAGCPM